MHFHRIRTKNFHHLQSTFSVILLTLRSYKTLKLTLETMNLMRFLSYMKHALMVVAMLTIVGISGCDDDDGPTAYSGTTLELLSDAKYQQASGADPSVALDSLVKYLSLYPSLTAKLSGTAEFTLFAPSNS